MEVCVAVIALASIQHHMIYDLNSPQDKHDKFKGFDTPGDIFLEQIICSLLPACFLVFMVFLLISLSDCLSVSAASNTRHRLQIICPVIL